MIVEDLCHKQVNDIEISYGCSHCFARNDNKYIIFYFGDETDYWPKYCFARNEYKIYFYDIRYKVMKECISEEKIIDMFCILWHSILLTQSGNVYEYSVKDNEREKSEKFIHFELKSFKNYSFENEKIVMISCGSRHSLALTESGRVFGWGDNYDGQLGVNVLNSSEPIIIELNDLKIKKVSCGYEIVYCFHVMEIFMRLERIVMDKLEMEHKKNRDFR
jgi:hypothetical protein